MNAPIPLVVELPDQILPVSRRLKCFATELDFVSERLTIFFPLKFTNLNCIAENSSPEHKYYTGIAREVFNVASDSHTLGWPTRHFFLEIFGNGPLAPSVSWAPVTFLKTQKISQTVRVSQRSDHTVKQPPEKV